MPLTSGVVPASNVPPVDALYQFIVVPVAARFATVGFAETQKDCVAVPVGAMGAAIIV